MAFNYCKTCGNWISKIGPNAGKCLSRVCRPDRERYFVKPPLQKHPRKPGRLGKRACEFCNKMTPKVGLGFVCEDCQSKGRRVT